MEVKPLISVIIPIYNAKEFINRTLDSMASQTYKNIEILCVDDCSTDNTLEILNQYSKKDDRVKVLSTNMNGGPAKSRNVGLDNASGEYIMFCDNDDTYSPKMCEIMLNTLLENDVDLVNCRVNVVNAECDRGRASYSNFDPCGKINLLPKDKHKITVHIWNKIFKKSIIDKYSIRFPDGVTSEDVAFETEYLSVISKYLGLEEKLYNTYFSPTSFSFKFGKGKDRSKKFDMVKVMEFIYNFFVRNDLLEKEKDFFDNRLKYCITYMLNYNHSWLDKRKIIQLYNDFVKNSDNLNYKIYSYNKFYKLSIINFLKLIYKSYWF